MGALRIRAGQVAHRHLMDHGLRSQDIKIVLGASGGPKWLVLAGLDRVLFGDWLPTAPQKIDLIGSSIGAWRMAAAAHPKAREIIERFQGGYFDYRYQKSDTVEIITHHTDLMLNKWISDDQKKLICSNPSRPLHIVTVRSKGLMDGRSKIGVGLGLLAAGLSTLISRKAIGNSFDRVVFSTEAEIPYQNQWSNLPMFKADLKWSNLSRVIQASGAIPGVNLPERDIPGAPLGLYRDGGFIDYHFDSPFRPKEGLVLYPHFYPDLVPGWFDKFAGRKTKAARQSHFIILAPNSTWVKELPGGEIPNRNDFIKMDNDERIEVWSSVMERSQELADDFKRMVEDRAYLRSKLELIKD